jgi:hypothetical protein
MIKHKNGTITHVGLVHSISYTESTAMDSYSKEIFALVYNIESEELEKVSLNGICQDSHWFEATAEIDLSDELRASYEAKKEKQYQARIKAEEAKTFRKGKLVTIVGGKKNKGQSGIIFWIGDCKFNRGTKNIGIDLGNEKVFINERNLELNATNLEKALKE